MYLTGFSRHKTWPVLGLCLALIKPAAQATTIYRWTDAEGHAHYSDRPPRSQTDTLITTGPDSTRTPAGLRPGERATLRAIEQRRQGQRKSAEAARREQRQGRDRHEQTCREHREQLRRGRRHVDGKTLAKYLRAHCW
ncbi:MAG: DUF4124 domain-containing protein [Gammaproteobacteria bacterium]